MPGLNAGNLYGANTNMEQNRWTLSSPAEGVDLPQQTSLSALTSALTGSAYYLTLLK